MPIPHTIRLADYKPPVFNVTAIDLQVDIAEPATTVRSRLQVVRNPLSGDNTSQLELFGLDPELISISIDGIRLEEDGYRIDGERMLIDNISDRCTVAIETRIYPSENTSLEGLYRTDGAYCTQCEAEGFRKITYFPDRPDVLAKYTTTITADEATCPIMLSNGNAVQSGHYGDGRHWVRWEDPFPKPSYLFALVAGDLACIEDRFTTASGRSVQLAIYVEHHNADQCTHAMNALKKSMKWDEEVFGLEYDLDRYMIVAIDDFNMGAMENKGLNIFNSKYVLAKPDTATDTDFANIETIIAHEYFHNWTGNRVTCRDWFQLSLKEGLTVFRDQEFSADQGSRAVKRIGDVRVLRTAQFAEDAGPMAHPVRPAEYMEINNFYTVTVYNKGAEVIRMMHTLIGADAFRRGMDIYFERHDGQAVTTDEFAAAMEAASGRDLGQFKRWYVQAGTPELDIKVQYSAGTLRIHVTQSTPPTPKQEYKLPFHIPITLGVLGPGGETLALNQDGDEGAAQTRTVLELTRVKQSFELKNMPEGAILSPLRGFSAPVKLRMSRSAQELAFIFAHDDDPFNRWDAGQTLMMECLLDNVRRIQAGEAQAVVDLIIGAVDSTLLNRDLDGEFIAECLKLPPQSYVAEQMETMDPLAIHAATVHLRRALAEALEDSLQTRYEETRPRSAYRFDAQSVARRALNNCILGLLAELGTGASRAQCLSHYQQADNMTDAMAGLTALAQNECGERNEALAHFEARWSAESLVMDKWLTVQATSRAADTARRVRGLMGHPVFDLKKPNKVRALIGAFAHANALHFNAADGSGYRFLQECITSIDALNPQIAARLLSAFSRWRRMRAPQRELMRETLQSIAGIPTLSRDCRELVTKALDH
ncbi:MAG: aminopeptidase N [Gammaproteobacteria bacterium]|nr:aminopeptidase N [Gammaproteobacteria bacterium]